MKKLQRFFLWVCVIGLMNVSYIPAYQVQAAPSVLYTNSDEITMEDTSVTMTVSCSSTLLVRSGPGKTYDRLGSVNNGEQVEVTGICSNGWYRISFEQKEGYVYGDYLVENKLSDVDHTEETGTIENTFVQRFSAWDLHTVLPLLIPIVIILLLAVSALLMFQSIRHDTEEDEAYEEDDDEEDDEEELDTGVMRKSTPLPRVAGTVMPEVDSDMLDSQIRNFVVDDIGAYLDEEKEESEEDPELAQLEDELEATQQHLAQLQRQMEQLKRKK